MSNKKFSILTSPLSGICYVHQEERKKKGEKKEIKEKTDISCYYLEIIY